MSELISQFIHLIDEFNDLGEKAESKLSERGERDKRSGNLPMYLDFWHKVVDKSKNRTHKIKGLLSRFPDNKDQMDQPLDFYRSLARYVAESPPVWSAYYPEIQKLKSQMAILLGQIDKKYTLGKYLMRERIAKYQS